MKSVAIGLLMFAVAQGAEPASRPGLEQINRETQELYGQAKGGIVHVTLPGAMWIQEWSERENLFRKWDKQLDPAVRARLDEAIQRAAPMSAQSAIVLDGRGHLLVPIYVDKASLEDRAVRVTLVDGQGADAVFVGPISATAAPPPPAEPYSRQWRAPPAF